MKKRVTLIIMLVASQTFAAEDHKPYAGQQNREVKALSASEVDGLLKGKGLGMAKPAELNKYPGPKHVLEIADKLDLSQEQLQLTQQLFRQMKSEAMSLGKKIVRAEKKLDELFMSGRVTDKSLKKALEEIAILRGKLRFVHLKTHLQQKKVMTIQQVHQYVRLRGYGGKHQGHH